ncbi:MAG: aspartate kinase [Flavobacteriales bacterium]|nr:aspartate kinase [Flavobacteriales bacterium]
MEVLKFGGTSVGSADRIKTVGELIQGGERKIVVLSAMSGTTNSLVEIVNCLFEKKNDLSSQLIESLRGNYKQVIEQLFISKEILNAGKELIESHFDFLQTFTQDSFTIHEEKAILAQGKLISTALLHLHLKEIGVTSVLLPALQFMRIDKDLEPDHYYIKENLERLLAEHSEQKIFITQGFICRNNYGEIDNLKRGGSDYSASLIGVAAKVKEVQIWTDIDGMHNNDPRVVDKTRPIKKLSFEEAAELAYFGAKILHPSSILPAKTANIPVRLKSTLSPSSEGTLITEESSGIGIKAIAAKDGISAIKINSGRMLLAHGFLRKVFEIFELYKTSIDMITTSEVAVSVTIDDDSYLSEIQKELEKYGSVEVDTDQTIVCVVGDFIKKDKGIANKVFNALESVPIRMISYGGSNHNISLLVNRCDKELALQNLNSLFD